MRGNSRSEAGDEMLRGLIRCPRNRIGPEHRASVTFVIFQDRVRLRRQRVSIVSAGIDVYRDHVRPFLDVLLTFRRKFVLIVLRPPVQITGASENKCRRRCRSGGVRFLRIEWNAGES